MPPESKSEPHTSEAPPETLESSNTKKVLSEIEGQVYFHRLAERRQTTEFENMSHVKGVGSLWILHGKAVQLNGLLHSGDFYQAHSFGSELSSNPNRQSVRPLTRFFPRTELRSYQQYKINGNLWIPALSFVSDWQDGESCESETLQVQVSRQNWLQLQKKKPLPEDTLFAFSAVQNRIRQSQKFQNFFRNWRTFGLGGDGELRGNTEGEKTNDLPFNYEMIAQGGASLLRRGSAAYERKNCKICFA